MVDRNAGQWLDLMVHYFDRVQQIALYLARERVNEQAVWNDVAQRTKRHQGLVQGLKAKVAQSSQTFDTSVVQGQALEAAVDYMGFLIKGLARHKYAPTTLINLMGDFQQNVLDSHFFLAFRSSSGQDAQAIKTAIQDITDLRARIAPLESHP